MAELVTESFRVDPTGRGYLAPSIFEAMVVIAEPCATRESRVFGRQANGNGGTTYASHSVRLAVLEGINERAFSRNLFILVSHGGGHERLAFRMVYDNGEALAALLALPEPVLYGVLYGVWIAASDCSRAAASETAAKYAQAFVEGRLRKSRVKQGRRTVTIDPVDEDKRVDKAA